ncbi:MAG TPA: transcriptional regulator [Pseudonocardiaceae bacterium]|nr:transcriptional regulator [Pseudonocardiaceae bacterium]
MPDPIMDELRAQLPDLVDEALDLPASVQTLDTVNPESARQTVRGDVQAAVLAQADDILRVTNPEISAIREAATALDQHRPPHQAKPLDEAVRHRRTLRAFGFVTWLGIAFPVAVWLSWPPLSSAIGGPLTVGIDIAAGIGVQLLAYYSLAGAGRRTTGYRLYGGGPGNLAVGTTAAYGLLLWRLGGVSARAMNGVSFWAVWIGIALGALVIVVMGLVLVPLSSSGEKPGRRLTTTTYRPGLITTATAIIVTAVLLLRVSAPAWESALIAVAVALTIQTVLGPWLASRPDLVAKVLPRPSAAGWRTQHRSLTATLVANQREWRVAADRVVVTVVSQQLNEAIQPKFGTELGRLDRTGLGQMRAGDRAVATAAFARLSDLVGGIAGGAIGMAGPRGAGKSTLLESYRAGKFLQPGNEHIALLEGVPVRYDAREFALHLYARTCAEVIRFCDRRIGADTAPSRDWRIVYRRWAPILLVVVLWLAASLVGANILLAQHMLAVAWWPLSTVLAAGTVCYLVARRPRSRPVAATSAAEAADSLPSLRRFARERLADIQFQQKRTTGWSGKISLPFGSEVQRSDSHEMTPLPLTYPQVVHEFGAFLGTTISCVTTLPNIATPAVVIILDELDKILSAEHAQEFINEVKALFSLEVPGFLFLVSVSEDALASFERRGLPVRDAFDSAFDVIFRVEYLKLDDARSVLASRILRLPEPFMCLCHCMAGGLPRELIRIARQVVATHGALADVCRDVVTEDLHGKVAGLRTLIARQTQDDAAASELMRHIDSHCAADPGTLLAAVAEPPIRSGNDDLCRLQLEMLGYLYYCGTVLEVFGPDFTEQHMINGRDGVGDGSFDTLTSVRQLFSVNARLAWLTVSAFRTAWDLPTIDPPS